MAAPDARELEPAIAEWIRRQRWFTGSGGTGALTVIGSFELPAGPGVQAETLLVLDEDPAATVLYQVPLTRRGSRPGPVEGLIREADGELLIDGPKDPAYVDALLGLALGGGGSAATGVRVEGVPLGWSAGTARVASARVLSGEQSNTSIIAELTDDEGPIGIAIVKVFRALHHGDNPDVVLQSAISAAGSARVPSTFGALVGSWPDPGRIDGVATGHLAVAQEFLAGTEDAWRVALGAARAGEDFRDAARALGEATAEVHRVLADRLGTVPADESRRRGIAASWRARAEQAVALVPALTGREPDIEAVFLRAEQSEWPPLQRVHGDYHLGQVLLVPERGWVLLDFEGEPLRPMAERSEPDAPLRDVAGMLRSFDYVAGSIAQEGGDAARWADEARGAFLAGYGAQPGGALDGERLLLAAFELDKALYECVYEARNRPAWLVIPQTAVQRLLST